MNPKIRLLVLSALLAVLVALTFFSTQGVQKANSTSPGNKVLARALAIELGQAQRRNEHEPLVSGEVVYSLLQASGQLDQRANEIQKLQQPNIPSTTGTHGCQNTFLGAVNNIRVNQDCSLRRQAEEVVAINPTNALNLIAGQNDSRIGFNHCGYDWSLDGGKTWGDQLPPFWQFINMDVVTFDACSDPTATFDAAGNAYVGGVLFEIAYADSAFVVMKSNAPIDGQFYHSPKVQPFQTFRDTPVGVVANDNNPNIFNDKEFIVADATAASPKANNVYATWTRFDTTGCPGIPCHSPIYFSQSTNGGATWSAGIEISGVNAGACTAFSGESNPNACDQDQGSHPVVGKDGTIYVAFGNGNTPTVGYNQHMIVKCPATKDCHLAASWTAPVEIGADAGVQPLASSTDPTTGCPGGRQCLPPNGYRLDDFVEGSLSVDNAGRLYFAWADGRNIAANCHPNGSYAGATPPCNNDVFYKYSTNGGATWNGPVNLTAGGTFGLTAQWMPWSAVKPDGTALWVAYYDREYGSCETTGCNDITMTKVGSPATAAPTLTKTRITTASMPNLVNANNPLQASFLGDYMWVATDSTGKAYVVWADTRGLNGNVEEDIYYATQGP